MQRLLECMSCPFHDTLNLSLKTDVIRLVTWLEDRKVRELEIADRNLLKNADTFDGAFRDYLQALRCPYIYTDATSTQCLDWLVSHAVSVEFEDNAEACTDLELRQNTEGIAFAGAVTEPQELTIAVDSLGALVGVARQGSSTPDYLRVIAQKIKLLLSSGAVDVLRDVMAGAPSKFTLDDFPLGFSTGDAVVDKVAVVIKMLHIFDFRELQNDLNALIVLGQEYTANPRTNSKLGKVGR